MLPTSQGLGSDPSPVNFNATSETTALADSLITAGDQQSHAQIPDPQKLWHNKRVLFKEAMFVVTLVM